ncbi:uncharacterized protein [Argopecten irradians]|uniref:uncharacterized protein isoform X3 n=1 Tax=Argopecten irradians TaxID=31199 RepID=UPI00371EEAEE
MAADNKCEGFLSGTTNMQSKEDEWRLTYAEVVWAMPAVHVPSERKKETVKKNTCRTECTDKLKRRRRRFKRMKFSNRRVLSSYSLDGEHIYQRLSPYNVTLDIDDSFAIVVKPKCVVSLFEETKVKNENNHIRSVKKTTKRKDTQITKKLGTHCCGTYHNNDIKFLDHYRKCHRSQGNSTDKQTSHKHTSTHNTQPKSLNRNNNTTNTTSQPNINNHFAQEDPTTSNTNTSIIGLHTGTSIPLLSCGDIEANPGPIYKCEHQTCGGNEQTFPSIQDLARHISGTHVFDIICGWGDCVWGAPDIIDRDMESHILQHIYKTTIFESLDSWCEALPSGYLDEHSTDLRLCPPALRGDLNLLLLDSSFTIKKRYTIFDHMMYLFHLQQKSPKEYYEKVENFISRQPPGKWEFKEEAVEQIGTYNPAKYGRAYYFTPSGNALRNIRKFTIDEGKAARNTEADDHPMSFETCHKLFSKAQISARGSTSLFLWFCPSHGHCYGFHMAYAEGRKDPYASLYSHIEVPPKDIFYDFGCNLQEYCLNRESGFFEKVRFFHDIFHGFSHKCSKGYRSSRLLGLDTINSEICEQFNSFLQCIKPAARQMNQTNFVFYLQFFLHIWNEQKHERYRKRLSVALAGSF